MKLRNRNKLMADYRLERKKKKERKKIHLLSAVTTQRL